MPLHTAVVCIADERSRAVCGLLLRHQGYGAVECRTGAEVTAVARRVGAQLVIADLGAEERAALHRELLTELPGVVCLFVHDKPPPDLIESITAVAQSNGNSSAN